MHIGKAEYATCPECKYRDAGPTVLFLSNLWTQPVGSQNALFFLQSCSAQSAFPCPLPDRAASLDTSLRQRTTGVAIAAAIDQVRRTLNALNDAAFKDAKGDMYHNGNDFDQLEDYDCDMMMMMV